MDHGLCMLSTLRRDGSVQASVVNAGVLPHPLTGVHVVGLVATGGSRKLHNLRADPRATIVARAGWHWATVEGTAEIIAPTTRIPTSTAKPYGSCYATSSKPPAEPTTTGTSRMSRWMISRRGAAMRCRRWSISMNRSRRKTLSSRVRTFRVRSCRCASSPSGQTNSPAPAAFWCNIAADWLVTRTAS
jgi:Pyridoxamine 5'-phosphate oxidase